MPTYLTIALLGALSVIIVLLLRILMAQDRHPIMTLNMGREVESTIERINASIEHHAEVSAVLGLMKQLDADPDALELIKSYPRTVQAAAALHYVNTLGAALQQAQEMLQSIYRGENSSASYLFGMTPADRIKNCQAQVDSIRAKLDAAVDACANL